MKTKKQKRKGFDSGYLIIWIVSWFFLSLGILELAKHISLEWSVGIIGGILCTALYFLLNN